jgi:hypothetical protein
LECGDSSPLFLRPDGSIESGDELDCRVHGITSVGSVLARLRGREKLRDEQNT